MTKRKVMIHILTSRLTLGRAIFDADEDALEEMERQNFGAAHQLLVQAQQDCEEIYLDGEDPST